MQQYKWLCNAKVNFIPFLASKISSDPNPHVANFVHYTSIVAFLSVQKNTRREKTLMWCKKSIVVSVANCQVNWHSYADLKVSQQESETKSEIESSSV